MNNSSRYLCAILAVPLIILLRFALLPLIGPGVPYVTLFPISVAVAIFAGMGPAILTGFLGSIAIDYFFIPPLYAIEFDIAGISRMAVVVLTSAFVGYVGGMLRTARAKAERQAVELRESQVDLNRAQAVAHSGSWRLDIRRNKITWSDESYRIFGVPEGTSLTYESFLGFIHPDDREYLDKKWKAAMAGEKYDIEHRIVVNGQIKWVRERAELELENDGSISGGFGTVTDITARKEAEATLLREKNFSDTTVDSLPGVFYLFNEQGTYLRWNKNFELVTEYSSTEIPKIHPIDLFRDSDKQLVAERIQDVFEKGEAAIEASLVTKGGLNIPYFFTGKRIMFDQKPCVVGTGIDIALRKKKEEELSRLNRTLKALSDSSQAMMHAKDDSQYLQEVCDIIVKDCGHAMVWVGFAENDEGKTVRPVANAGFEQGYLETLNITWADTERGRGPTGTAIRTGKPSMCRNMLTDPAFEPWRGEALKRGYASSIVLPLIFDGKTFGALTIYSREPATFSDNEVKLLTELADDLAYGIATIELRIARDEAEQALRKAYDELARSNKDLEQFAYVASHDLQEPLRAVSGFVELMRRNLEKHLDEKTNEYMNFTIDGAKRMQSLINGLLEYSRVGTQGKNPQQVNSKEALDEALARLYTSIDESGAKITADDLPVVYFDDLQLTRLFQNLIGNAIKFRGDQAPQIHVSAVRQDAVWRFAISDNGIGIEPQYAERIFMIFQRLHTRKTYPGTGIGLAICKKIVERHGGKIWVESTQERGSTFYFTVPGIEVA